MKLLKITVHLSDTLKIKIKEIENVIEKPKTYVFGNSRINKDTMVMKPNSIFRNTITSANPTLNYETYCLESDKEIAQTMLINELNDRFMVLSKGLDRLRKAITVVDYS